MKFKPGDRVKCLLDILKPGDKVECIDDEYTNKLLKGRIYTVKEIHKIPTCTVVLCEYSGESFGLYRFKHAETPETLIDHTVTSECVCTSRQLFIGGCTCGFLVKK